MKVGEMGSEREGAIVGRWERWGVRGKVHY